MRTEHLDYLACPRCVAPLRLEATETAEDGHVLEGVLTCPSCPQNYPVTGGIPRLLPDETLRSQVREKTAERFSYEWNHFRDFELDEEVESLKTWFKPRKLEDLTGLNVLEAGCGMGRHATIAAHYGVKTLIAMDLGYAVGAAFENTRHLPAVCIVQGDIYHPPLQHKAFDAAFSLGVLHHLPDPDRGFSALAVTVRDEGWFQVWVYGREGNGWIVHIIDPIRRLTSRMPLGLLRQLSLLISVPLLVGARTLYRLPVLGRRLPYAAYIQWLSSFGLRKVHAIVLDHAVTPVAHYMTRADVEKMVQRAGWRIIELEHNRGMSWGVSARHAGTGDDGRVESNLDRDLAEDIGQISSGP